MKIKVLGFLILIRILSVFLVQTYFSPDEYYQSLEIGHKLAFGYGYETWEWKRGIRSYLYPAAIGFIYKILELLKLDTTYLIIIAPRILQALVSAFADYRLYTWCNNKKWSLFLIATSWFSFYTGSRTLINTLEASLTAIALSFFPWGHQEQTGFLWIVGVLSFIRPTSIITWLPFCIYHVTKSRYSFWEMIVKRYLIIGVSIYSVLISLDSYYHGSFIVTPYEFLKANIFDGVGSFYGTHPFHWYITSGLPAVLGIGFLPFSLAILNIIRAKPGRGSEESKVVLTSIVLTLAVLSLVSHKEFRFLLQIFPQCLYIITMYLSSWSRSQSKMAIWFVVFVIFVSNLVPAGYLGNVHQQGTIKVMNKVTEIAQNFKSQEGRDPKIFFMTPCHSTPMYSHMHINVTTKILRCEPDFLDPKYVNEADEFFEAPMKWIRQNLPVRPLEALPSHIVLFDSLAPKIEEFLSIYTPVEAFFHADYPTSKKEGGNIIIFQISDHILHKKQGTSNNT